MRLEGLYRSAESAIAAFTVIGAFLILVEAFWISYGVFARYVMKSPDRVVTEATAILLVPLAFVGMAYALRDDAFPRVTLFLNILPRNVAWVVESMNLAVIVAIGGFLTIVSCSAVFRTMASGAQTPILRWPEYVVWIPLSVLFATFTAFGAVKLVCRLGGVEIAAGRRAPRRAT